MDHLNIRYYAICTGDESLQTDREKSLLFCWYEFKQHPTFVIGPRKMEFLSRNPDAVQAYDVISDGMIQKIEIMTRERLALRFTPPYTEEERKKRRFDVFGVSLMASIEDTNPIDRFGLQSIPRNIEQITGLRLMAPGSSETLFVKSYAFSGIIRPHIDSVTAAEKEEVERRVDERIATAIYYLSDVEMGGGTALILPGVVAKPVKNSVVFWFNTFSDGTVDMAAHHGGCPISFGHKLIGNKWMSYRAQFKNFPCGLKPMKRYRVSVNGNTAHRFCSAHKHLRSKFKRW